LWGSSGNGENANQEIGVCPHLSTGYHDWAAGCRDLARCFWLNLAFDVPAGSLAPNAPHAWRFADYRANVDTVFEAAHKLGQMTLR
jgi:hypothetical protein